MRKHIVCYSGGHSSALVALEVAKRYGTGGLVLVNHDIHPRVEDADVKRFKHEVAAHLKVPITYVNMPGWDTKDQFDVVVEAQAFKVGNGTALCTNRLKTAPFMTWLKTVYAPSDVVYYGFDASEKARIQRRSQIMGALGYLTDFPLAFWPRYWQSTREIIIEPPLGYSTFNHANCVGCLKAGRQHWYVVYCTRQDIWKKARAAEDTIGYTIIKGVSLEELEPLFKQMQNAGIQATEKIKPGTFWASVRKQGFRLEADEDAKPCECVI